MDMMRSSRLSTIAIAVTLVLALALAGSALAADYKGFPRGDSLITPEELKSMMDKEDPKLVILAVAKPTLQYRKGHIPGSINVWRPDYEPEVGNPWPYDGMILNKAEFQEFARNLGIDNDSKVVVYDHKYDATRMWWAFYLYGKKDVRVLDGGYDAWVAADYDVDRIFAEEAEKKGNFTASTPMPGWIAEIGDIWRAKTSPDMHVWDTRGDDEWTGAKTKGNSTCGGRIPWAKQLNWPHFKKKPTPDAGQPTEFKTAAEIKKVADEFGLKEGHHHIFYCQSGVRTTTEIFALYLMGYDPGTLHNYDGSWLEWSYHYCDQEDNGRAIDRATLIEANK
jgi:thiosulfate/3-mercaptopyruvate sulfurtransferase